jgi:hypothetical protein
MRGAVPFRRRAVAEFGRFSTGLLIAYVPVAAILTFAAGVPLVGAVGVPALAALFAVLKAEVGGSEDPNSGGSRPHDYDPGFDPALRSGGGHGGWHYSGTPGGGEGGGGGDSGGW